MTCRHASIRISMISTVLPVRVKARECTKVERQRPFHLPRTGLANRRRKPIWGERKTEKKWNPYLYRRFSRRGSFLGRSSSSCSSIVCFWTGTGIREWLGWHPWPLRPGRRDFHEPAFVASSGASRGPPGPCTALRGTLVISCLARLLWRCPWKKCARNFRVGF